jgi:hypothetical protein
VQNYRINLDFDLFLQSKNGGPSPRDVHRWCFRSTMDPWAERGRSSPEVGHAGVPMHGTSPWQHGEQEEWMGGLGRPGVIEGRRRRSKLNEEVIRARG